MEAAPGPGAELRLLPLLAACGPRERPEAEETRGRLRARIPREKSGHERPAIATGPEASGAAAHAGVRASVVNTLQKREVPVVTWGACRPMRGRGRGGGR